MNKSAWRDAGKLPRILGMDARAVFPIFFWLLHMRLWTLYLALASVVFFAGLEKFGYTLPVFLRLVRHKLRGNVCYARPWWFRRRFLD